MRKVVFFFSVILLSGCVLFLNPMAVGQIKAPDRGFISSEPAETWEQGLLSGNGTIGANVFSQPLDETIIFTHERLFLPMGAPLMPPDQSARLFEIRKLIADGKYKQATQLQFDLSGQTGFMYPDPFVPAFDLKILMNTDKEIRDYLRSVNFETGEAVVQWSDKHGSYERKLFVSRADGIAIMQMKGSEPGIVNCELRLRRRIPDNKLDYKYIEGSVVRAASHITDVEIKANDNYLSFKNRFSHAYPGSIHALEGLAQVEVKGGTVKTVRDRMIIEEADEILVLIDIALLYDPDQSKMEAMQQRCKTLESNYDLLLNRHARIHGELFKRVKLDLGGGADHQLTTEALHKISTNDHLNPALIEKQFDAGRYNIISSTGELPPNLQGNWAGTYVPDWASDYTHNGNVPSAIASMLKGNTPELMLAYINYIESLIPWMEINAKHLFGARGIVLPSRTTTHGYNNALNPSFAGGFWVGGAAWAASFFYDYYLYTGDKKFLAERAIPFMEKCAVFFEDYLYEGADGKFIFSPTQSPENTPGNSNSQGSYNATSEVVMAKELFRNLISASRELGMNRERVPTWQTMLSKMPAYMTDEHGFIKEWLTPRLDNNDLHWHSSQFYELYHGMMLEEIASNPTLIEAFKKSIHYRLDKHWREDQRGFMSFGLVQLALVGASLGDGEIVHECLKHLVNRFWLDNLASMHNHKSLFNMDISGGMPAVIIKALVASESGRIRLLPALPEIWPSGEIQGVLCRGQIEVKSLKWESNTVNVVLLSAKNQTIELEVFDRKQKLRLSAGKEISLQIVKQ
ncbi:MAG: glycoside hydrolase N-terminal domain-containing protein [Cyclobacteriaceae bacterium]|nr:glycoside hydrolase N-terminal domain-containing protein [Cyclobacteriaceae bacterium]